MMYKESNVQAIKYLARNIKANRDNVYGATPAVRGMRGGKPTLTKQAETVEDYMRKFNRFAKSIRTKNMDPADKYKMAGSIRKLVERKAKYRGMRLGAAAGIAAGGAAGYYAGKRKKET